MTNEFSGNEFVYDEPVGITAPPIDSLMNHVSSKYALAIFAAKRARQINSYFLGDDAVYDFPEPLVNRRPGEKPLSIALREIDSAKLVHQEG